MTCYSLTCTRSEDLSSTTTSLLEYFKRAGVQSHILCNYPSIFEAYDKGLNSLSADSDDTVILCHDDITILTDPLVFTSLLEQKLDAPNTGFVGVAGASVFTESGVWGDRIARENGYCTGEAFHGTLQNHDRAIYGPYGKAVVLDGLFIAAKVRTLKEIGLKKPDIFMGNWDYYDILYTFKAFRKNLINYTLPIQIIHESRGKLAGRDSWHKNREAFIHMYHRFLPAKIIQ